MARTKNRPLFGCSACGATQDRWAGRCAACGAMGTLAELDRHQRQLVEGLPSPVGGPALSRPSGGPLQLSPAHEVGGEAPPTPIASGIAELDRVLGGGFVPGGSVVIGGEPGIGKSTLLAQACAGVVRGGHRALYVSAEESLHQVRARLQRLGAALPGLDLAASEDAAAIAEAMLAQRPALVVVDSIQLVRLGEIDGIPGSTTQVRGCAALLADCARRAGSALVLVGHVTKEGGLAGPRLLEHLVDAVLSFEGDRYQELRSLRALKNRYGSTNELGLFTMDASGLVEVRDPGGLFIAGRDDEVPGSCVVPSLEGNRALLVEIQALVESSEAPMPARRVSGLDPNRVAMVLAVLSRRLRLGLGRCDVYVNCTGGARVWEPAADLGIALAVVSALREIPVPRDLVALGEVGLGGELRPASRYDLRAAEARRLGFRRLLGPGPGSGRGRIVAGRLAEAITEALA